MKRGFTLVEIIISIGLIVLIGTISIFSFNLIKKNNKEKTLNNMSDEILTALRLYIETNDEAKSRIYENYEGMAITLKSLENEGLIEFPSNLDIQNNDDYVVAMLSNESDCSDITTVESWDLTNGPLYICSKGGSQNLFSVGGAATNLSKSTREIYYFRGSNPHNYIQLNGTGDMYRIMYIDRDDSLVLYANPYNDGQYQHADSNITTKTLNNTFSGKTQKIYGSMLPVAFDRDSNSDNYKIICHDTKHYPFLGKDFSSTASTATKTIYSKNHLSEGETFITIQDVLNGYTCEVNESPGGWLWNSFRLNQNEYAQVYAGDNLENYNWVQILKGVKIHLKPCMQITGGTGDIATPFILKDNCIP